MLNRLGRHEPLALLLLFGFFMGSIVAVATYVITNGAQVLTLAFHQFVISGAVLLVICIAIKRPVAADRQHLTFYVVSGVLGIAGPHVLLFFVVKELGAGFASMAYIFPPLFTYAMALIVGLERFHGVRAIGLLLGLLGSLLIIFAAERLRADVELLWFALLYLIPLVMAWGNIYRAMKWPAGLGNLEVTTGVLCASALLLLIPAALGDTSGLFLIQPPSLTVWTALQALITGAAYLVFFRLQTVGGPVYLSQAGYVITGVGLLYGFMLFGERFPTVVWLGFGVALGGVLIVTLHQSLTVARTTKPRHPSRQETISEF